MRFELSGTSSSNNTAVGQINLGVVIGTTMSHGVNHPAVGTRHIEDFFLNLAFRNPALNDLHPLQRSTQRITKRPNDKRWRSTRLGREIRAHRHTTCISLTDHVLAVD